MDITRRCKIAVAAMVVVLMGVLPAAYCKTALPKVYVNGKEFYYYEAKKGDSLYGLMKNFNWNEDTLRSVNSGIDGELKKGTKIFYPVDRPAGKAAALPDMKNDTAPEKSKEVSNVKASDAVSPQSFFHTVREGDTLYSLAREFNTSVADILALNPGMDEYSLKIGGVLRIPMRQPGAETEEKIEVGTDGKDEVVVLPDSLRRPLDVVLLLPDPSSKKDIDFLRGFLLGLEYLRSEGRHLNICVLESGTDASGVLADPRVRNASLLITTCEKNFPGELAELSTERHIPLINVFDLKTRLYEDNPDFVQILPPTEYFNAAFEKYMLTNFADKVFLFVGTDKAQDSESQNSSMLQAVAKADATFMTLADIAALKTFSFDPETSYIVVPESTAKADAEAIAEYISTRKGAEPGLNVAVLGKPNWIVFAETLVDKYADADIYIPSRFFFNSDQLAERDFVASFTQAYDQKPVRSFPMYSVMGRDIAAFLLPAVADRGHDFINALPFSEPMQMPFNFERVDRPDGGIVNTASELLHITPYKTIEIITLK